MNPTTPINPHLKVLREKSQKDWTLSEFHILDVKSGVGVEDEERAIKVHGETRIPNGLYEFSFIHSPKFSGEYFQDERGYLSKIKDQRFAMPHLLLTVLNVPNFSGILWHWGNTDDDTDGCYIVGSTIGDVQTKNGLQRGVLGSRVKYIDIHPILYQLWQKNQLAGVKSYVQYMDKIAA